MTKRTIDLDALAAELRAAGYDTAKHPEHYHGGTKLFSNKGIGSTLIVYPDGRFQAGQTMMTDDHWPALDIIRRHVAPAAGAPEGLRDRIESEVFSAFVGDFPAPPLSRKARDVADAVLAVLPSAPRYEMTEEMWSAFSSAKEAYSHGNNAETDVCDALDRMTAMLEGK